jgi:phage terminase small subunit
MSEQSASVIQQYDRPLDALAHRLWTHWSQQIAEQEDISEERIQGWQELWVPYGELPEVAKETDTRLVEQYCEEEPDYNRSVETGSDRDGGESS